MDKNIGVLKELIEELKKKNIEEEDWKMEEIINNLQHEYELNLLEYKSQKELEKLRIEEKIKEMQFKIKMDKIVEFEELKKSSDFVDKIIYCIQKNNFNINN